MQAAFLGLILSIITVNTAHAYIGPGMGLGAISGVLAIVFALILGLFGIIWYPFKRLIKKARNRQK